ncbi:hypothetical protein PM082_013315 [Marasmius tenuissimus]|nr:hypothetical protein PM082_013315 [Marasmius tenuissimus]
MATRRSPRKAVPDAHAPARQKASERRCRRCPDHPLLRDCKVKHPRQAKKDASTTAAADSTSLSLSGASATSVVLTLDRDLNGQQSLSSLPPAYHGAPPFAGKITMSRLDIATDFPCHFSSFAIAWATSDQSFLRWARTFVNHKYTHCARDIDTSLIPTHALNLQQVFPSSIVNDISWPQSSTPLVPFLTTSVAQDFSGNTNPPPGTSGMKICAPFHLTELLTLQLNYQGFTPSAQPIASPQFQSLGGLDGLGTNDGASQGRQATVATPLVSPHVGEPLEGDFSDSDDSDDEDEPSSSGSKSKHVRPNHQFHPYGRVANVMRGKAPFCVYRTIPPCGRLDTKEQTTRRFNDTIKRDELPDDYMDRLRTLSHRCFESLVTGRRQDLARLKFKNYELEDKMKRTQEQLDSYARVLWSQGIDLDNLPPRPARAQAGHLHLQGPKSAMSDPSISTFEQIVIPLEPNL